MRSSGRGAKCENNGNTWRNVRCLDSGLLPGTMQIDARATRGLHSPELLIRSVDFAEIEALQTKGDWATAGVILNKEAKALERGGAQVLILATNTMHKLAAQMMIGVDVPFVHIADATAEAIKTKGCAGRD